MRYIDEIIEKIVHDSTEPDTKDILDIKIAKAMKEWAKQEVQRHILENTVITEFKVGDQVVPSELSKR